MSAQADSPSDPDTQPTLPLIGAGTADRCPVCAAQMAPDQRYCVECGTRRGSARFQLAGAGPAGAGVPAGTPVIARAGGLGGFLRSSSGVVLFVTVLIVLVAIGVGVLIGHDGRARAIQTKVEVIDSGGASGGTAAGSGKTNVSIQDAGNTGANSGTTSSTHKHGSKAAKTSAKTTPKAAAKSKAAASTAAKKFSKSATDKSTLGGSCTKGTAGCSSTGKQTGALFGG